MSSDRIVYAIKDSSRRKKRFSFFSFKPLLFFLSAALFFSGLLFLIFSKEMRVNQIHITGLRGVSEEEVRVTIENFLAEKIMYVFPRDSFFLLRAGVISALLEHEFPKLRVERVEKSFPHTASFVLQERVPWGIVCRRAEKEAVVGSLCVYMDSTGFVYEKSPDFFGKLFTKITVDTEPKILDHVFEESDMQIFRLLQERFLPLLEAKSFHYEISRALPREIRVSTEDGLTLLVRKDDDFENVYRVLKTVLEEEIKAKKKDVDYIDLRFGNKVFYRFKEK